MSVAKFVALKEAVAEEVVEMDDVLDIVVNALVSRHHAYLGGPPGVAKSYTAKRMFTRIANAGLCHIELFKMSSDSDALGPLDIPKYRDGLGYARLVKGYLPGEPLSIVDELPNASASLLQGLHGILNERQFKQAGVMTDVPLSTLIATANTSIGDQHTELAALTDRFIFFKQVTAPSASGMRKMLNLSEPDPRPAAEITWQEVLTAQTEARDVLLDDIVLDALIAVREKIAEAGITTSPRRLRQCLAVVRAEAYLAGERKADTSHLEILANCLWTKPDQASAVARAVLEVASPKAKEALLIQDSVVDLADKLVEILAMDAKDPSRAGAVAEQYKKTKRIATKAMKMANAPGRAGRMANETIRRLEDLHLRTMREGMSIKNPPSLHADLEDPDD